MGELEKVLNLQIQYNKLDYLKKELERVENDQEVPMLERISISDKKNLERVLILLKGNEKDTRESSRELEDLISKLNKTEKTVYNGEINDLKQLDHLNKEKIYLTELIDSLENKIIEYLEKNDKYENSINEWQEEIGNKEKMIRELEITTKRTLISIKKEIERQKLSIEEFSKDIEPGLLKQFLSIKERKKSSGIATVVGNVCSECNIMIRPAQVDRIRLGKEIFICENCGRILIFPGKDREN